MPRPRTMRHGNGSALKYLYFGCILLIISTSLPAFGQRLDMMPSLTLNGGYNDNILFNSTDTIDAYYTSARPEFNLGLASDRYDLSLDTSAGIFRYPEEKDLDYENYRYNMDGRYRLSERLNISGGFGYLKDTTLDAQLEETGQVLKRQDRKRYQGDSTLSYGLNEVSGIDIEYQYRSTEYESSGSTDRTANSVNLSYKRWFNSRLDQLTLRPSYTIADTEDNRDIEYYNFSFGWTHIFSETLTMKSIVGYGQTITTENGDQESSRTGNADLSITQTGDVFSFMIGIRNNITLNSDGELQEVDRLYCRMNKKLTERLSARLYGGVYINRQPETYDTIDSVLYDIRSGLSYEITENHVMNASYRYTYGEDRTVSENQARTRNMIELNLVFRFPMQK